MMRCWIRLLRQRVGRHDVIDRTAAGYCSHAFCWGNNDLRVRGTEVLTHGVRRKREVWGLVGGIRLWGWRDVVRRGQVDRSGSTTSSCQVTEGNLSPGASRCNTRVLVITGQVTDNGFVVVALYTNACNGCFDRQFVGVIGTV